MERWLAPNIELSDYYDLMEALWDPLVGKGFSFVVRSADDEKKLLGAALNFDTWDEPEVDIRSKLLVVFDFLEYLECPIRETNLPHGKGKVIHSFMMATNADLSPAENVIVINEMENECLALTRRKGFEGIFTTNTSPLTQVM